MLVHSVYLRLWLEMGLFGMLAYIAIIVLSVIAFVKTFRTNNEILGLTVFMAFVLIIHNLGSLEAYTFIYFIMLFAMLMRTCKDKIVQTSIDGASGENAVETVPDDAETKPQKNTKKTKK